MNIVRHTCCFIDLISLPIIYTHNGDGTLQNYELLVNNFADTDML